MPRGRRAGRPAAARARVVPEHLPLVELLLAIGVLAIGSMTLGLLISAAVNTSEKTMPLLIVVVIFQVVMTGGVFALNGHPGLQQVSWIAPSRWGYAAVASTSRLNVIQFPAVPKAPAKTHSSSKASGNGQSSGSQPSPAASTSAKAGASPKASASGKRAPTQGHPNRPVHRCGEYQCRRSRRQLRGPGPHHRPAVEAQRADLADRHGGHDPARDHLHAALLAAPGPAKPRPPQLATSWLAPAGRPLVPAARSKGRG